MEHEIEIPPILCSSDTGAPIERCMVCDKYLLDEGTPYFIEKSVRRYASMQAQQVIFEYAVCLPCSVALHESLSEESRARTTRYLMENGRIEGRREKLSRLDNSAAGIGQWLDRCLLKDTPIDQAQEYQIVAQCAGRKLQLHDMPFVLSLEAIEELTGLLSAKSRGEMDDFIGRYFSGPPEVAALLRKRPPVLL